MRCPARAILKRRSHLTKANTAIARAIDVSPRTVAKHLEHIYRKLGVSSRVAVYRARPLNERPV
jgi:DNA-binding CsgD family transcriptional regulator